MADMTANSGFGLLSATRDPSPKAAAPGTARFAASRSETEEPRASSAGAALAEFNQTLAGPIAKARLAMWMGGGAVSLALVAGIGIWGYKLVLREVLGLPVVVAESGPMRVAPADPGGEVVADQGLSVNAIPAAGTAAPPSDVLVLAPPGPGLAPEDMEVAQSTAEAGEVMAGDPGTPAAEAAEAAALPVDPNLRVVEVLPSAADALVAVANGETPAVTFTPTDRPMTADEVIAFADQIAAGARAFATAEGNPEPTAPAEAAAEAVVAQVEAPVEAPAATPEAAAPAETVAALIPADVPGVATALRPAARPARALAAAAPAVAPEAAPAEAAPTEVALTAAIPSGTALVQLGAFDSAEIAASEWTRLQGLFGDFLEGRDRVIQEAESGGRTFFRLRATGFADLADARRLCAALTAEDAACIPVVTN